MATARKYFEIPVGDQLGRFRVLHEIGRGGHGVVYRAEDVELGRDVALKTIAAQPGSNGVIADAAYEARLLARVSDPHVMTILDVVRRPEMTGLVLELVDGPTLHRVAKGKRLSAANLTAIAIHLAEGIRALHRAGVVHGDVKPSNICIAKNGVLKILDLSAGRWVSWSGAVERAPQSAVGTVPYMSPEQLLGVSGDPRSDIWSFGVVLFELATGAKPFELATDPAGFKHLLEGYSSCWPDLGSEVPPALQRIIMRAISGDPAQRFQSAGELLKALWSVASAEFPVAISGGLHDVTEMLEDVPTPPSATKTVTVAIPVCRLPLRAPQELRPPASSRQ